MPFISAATITLNAAAASTVRSGDFAGAEYRGVIVNINLTTVTTATVTITFEGKDPLSGTYYTVLASTGIVAAGFSTLSVYPGIAVTANVSANAPLPASWDIKVGIVGGSAAVTGTISTTLLA